jgi:hypothetical protein
METILKIAADVYGAGPGIFDPIALIWAAERASKVIGVDATKAGVKKLNAQRRKYGKMPVTFEFGHPLF